MISIFIIRIDCFHRAKIATMEKAVDEARNQIDLKKAENYGMTIVSAFQTFF